MKALVGAFNQEKALVGAFSVIVQPVVEPMEHNTTLITSFVFQAGTVEAEGLNLTIETLRQRDDSRLDTGDLAQGLVKKVGRHSWFP